MSGDLDVNQEVTQDEIKKIRDLGDFDLIMLISEIHDHGWKIARGTLRLMPPMDPISRKSLKGG